MDHPRHEITLSLVLFGACDTKLVVYKTVDSYREQNTIEDCQIKHLQRTKICVILPSHLRSMRVNEQ